jgi:hypothetical protein
LTLGWNLFLLLNLEIVAQEVLALNNLTSNILKENLMSYEGRVQVICEKGHYSVLDTFDETEECHCGEKLVWYNYVDDTNGEAVNEIKMSDLAKFIKTPPEFCKCCGHQTSEPLYNVPSSEQVEAMRTITYSDGIQYYT